MLMVVRLKGKRRFRKYGLSLSTSFSKIDKPREGVAEEVEESKWREICDNCFVRSIEYFEHR